MIVIKTADSVEKSQKKHHTPYTLKQFCITTMISSTVEEYFLCVFFVKKSLHVAVLDCSA